MTGFMAWFAENSWLYVGSVSGSLIAMSAARNLTLAGRLQTLIVGTLSGCLAGPAICELWFAQYDPQNSRIPSFICGLVGLTALGLIPIIIKKSKDLLEKYQFKIVATEPHDE